MRKQNFKWEKMKLGVCYYPEHWDKTLWENDLLRMKEAGITVIRIGEFAWNLIEIKEGIFDFSFFDEFLLLCEQHQMDVIFGTPTATPPAWITEKYPDILNVRIDGISYQHGERRHYTYNSKNYIRLSSIIVTKMAEHYGQHPNVVGWQIDNEFNCHVDEFYSESDTVAFREFLKEKYESLEKLNTAWGTIFWNQTYSEWSQVNTPRVTPSMGINPHQHLDYYRFVSESTIRFCKMQERILRKYVRKDAFITTNGMFKNIDNHTMQDECLDVFTYDSYPNFAFGVEKNPLKNNGLNDRKCSKNLTEVRSVCSHFGIMEQQVGAGSWTILPGNPAPRPGQLTLWALQSVAHGADFISFFRWRTCNIGTELYWHGILDYDNRKNRKFFEVQDFSKKLEKLNPLCGSNHEATFAIVKDYDNEWDTVVDSWHNQISYNEEEVIFNTTQRAHIPYDLVYINDRTQDEELASYPVLIYAHPMIITQERVELLERYVKNGGILIMGCRAGLKDIYGRAVMLPQPGLLQQITQSDVLDFTFTSPAEDKTFALWNENHIETPIFNDILTPLNDAKIVAEYGNSYYKDCGALVENNLGKGKILHFGSTFSQSSILQIFDYLNVKSPFESYLEVPEELELVLRSIGEKQFIFVLNYQQNSVEYSIKKELKSLFSEQTMIGNQTLAPFEVEVFEICK